MRKSINLFKKIAFFSFFILMFFFGKPQISYADSNCQWTVSQIPIHSATGTIYIPRVSISLIARHGENIDPNTPIGIYVHDPKGFRHFIDPGENTDDNGQASLTIDYDFDESGTYTIEVGAKGLGNWILDWGTWCRTNLIFDEDGILLNHKPYSVCQENEECEECLRTEKEANASGEPYKYEMGGTWTALGCIPSGSPSDLMGWIFPFLLGIAGGIAIILMIIGGLQVATSAGNPERVESGKNMITSALTGLLLIIFSIFILRVIGVNLLGILE